nr:uncharacterized protein LOC109150699 isoform X6 [Ipomoea batatas]
MGDSDENTNCIEVVTNQRFAGRGLDPRVTHIYFRNTRGTCAAKSTKTTPGRKASSDSSSHEAFTPCQPDGGALHGLYLARVMCTAGLSTTSRDDEIFRYKAYKESWGNVASLQEGNKVAYRVVDTWTCVPNYRELTKDAVLPNRLFASTKTALQSAVNYTALRSLRLGWFTKSLDEDFSNSPHEIWRGIHICGHDCEKVDIIDSSFVAETKDKLYGQTPKQFVDLLSTFLDDKLETEIAS